MRPSSPFIPFFLLFFAGFLISSAVTPLVSEVAPAVSSISDDWVFREVLRTPSLLSPLPNGIGNTEVNESARQQSLPVSKELVAPGDLSDAPQALVPEFALGRGPATRSLLCSDVDKQVGFLLASSGGTVFLMDSRSRVPHWKFSTGFPLSYSEQAFSNVEHFVYSGEDGSLYEFKKGIGDVKLNSTIEEYVVRTPEMKGSIVTLGSKSTTLFILHADNGTEIYRDHSSTMWTAMVLPLVEEKSVLSKLETGKSYIFLLRTDYTLSSSNLGVPLWSTMVARVSATYVTIGLPPKMGDKLVVAPLCQTDIPVFLPHTAGKLREASYEHHMLPSATDAHNMLTSNGQDEKQGSFNMPANPSNCGLLELVSPLEQSVALQSHFRNDPTVKMPDEEHISWNYSEDVSNAANECLSGSVVSEVYHGPRNLQSQFQCPMNFPYEGILSRSQNICKDTNSILGEHHYDVKQNGTKMSPGATYGIFAWCFIVSLLICPALCYLKLRKPVTYEKQLDNIRGKQNVVSKKRKARKSGNVKTGASTIHHERHTSSEKENAETDGQHMQSDELRSFTNLVTSIDAGDGRWVGKLFVSNSEIGRGSNGTLVLEGVYDGRPVAVKRLLRAHHDVALKEIQNLIASDRHPNIVRWYGVEQDLDFVYISLERCTCSLSDLIELYSDSSSNSAFSENPTSNTIAEHKVQLGRWRGIEKDHELWRANGFPSYQLLKLMRDVVSGLAHLHELGIIHRDMKPQNVLISYDRYLNAKISDMGISKRLLQDMSSLSHHATGYGSSGWQAPEQLLHGRQTRAMDLFSLGCILFFCITKGKHPFGTYFERDSNILNNRVDLFLVDHIPEAVHLFSQLLDPNPNMRPNAVEVMHHPLFWSSEMRLTFLRDTSDRVELEDRGNQSELLKELENVAPVAFGGKWGDKLDTAFISDMGRYRKYNFDCMRDLLRVIRNKFNHYRELPKELQEILGSVPEGFDRYFTSRFPKLLIEVYRVVYKYCREEDCFSKYFKSTLV